MVPYDDFFLLWIALTFGSLLFSVSQGRINGVGLKWVLRYKRFRLCSRGNLMVWGRSGFRKKRFDFAGVCWTFC